MVMPVYSYDPPDRFVAGTVGQPGERTFYLQARSGPMTTSVALEKGQVAQLAERLEELLDEVGRRTDADVAADQPSQSVVGDDGPLELPLNEDFTVGAIALAWDHDGERVIIEAQELSDEPLEPLADDVPEDGPGILRVRITAADARAFSRRALKVVGQGRPPCPLCGLPLDPAGHICPRQNGHRAGHG
jgi:uncharacterized repeat protein (TIGR03847 family)